MTVGKWSDADNGLKRALMLTAAGGGGFAVIIELVRVLGDRPALVQMFTAWGPLFAVAVVIVRRRRSKRLF